MLYISCFHEQVRYLMTAMGKFFTSQYFYYFVELRYSEMYFHLRIFSRKFETLWVSTTSLLLPFCVTGNFSCQFLFVVSGQRVIPSVSNNKTQLENNHPSKLETRNDNTDQAWWLISVFPAHGRLRYNYYYELKVS